MVTSKARACQCSHCQQPSDHPDKKYHQQVNLFLSRLNQQQRRLYVAIESNRIGQGGVRIMSQITGLAPETIKRGRIELNDLIVGTSTDPVRKSRVGRPLVEEQQPTLLNTLEQLLTNEVAGDPMNEQKWVRVSLRNLSQQLDEQGLKASTATISRLLRKMGFSLRVNFRKKNGVRANYPERDEQFKYIALERQVFSKQGLPIISVDTKKKELIGDLKKGGKAWCREAEEVHEHDFRSIATYRAVPYGIYDLTKNEGYVYVGISDDTPEFAVDAIASWWQTCGYRTYIGANKLLILADGGGSNGCRSRAWKYQLQTELCDRFQLEVTVCHYPTGCSKWNPIEHRLFSHISINWYGRPLRTLEMMLGYIRGTSTSTGLTVKAVLLDNLYKKGQRVLRKDFEQLRLETHITCPDWNYTISPR